MLCALRKLNKREKELTKQGGVCMDSLIQEEITHPCDGCHYWRKIGQDMCCHYLLVTGRRRMCKPGKNCIRRKPVDLEAQKMERRMMFHQMLHE